MLDEVEYIQSIFKINTDNPYVITDLAEEVEKIDSFDDFRSWLKININHFDAQYMNPFQKFTFLIRMYLRKQLELKNAERIENSKIFSKNFSYKVKQVSHLVDEKEILAQQIKLDGKQFFTDYEISQINKLGGLSACIRIQRSTSGADALAEKISEMAYDMMVSNIIEYKPKEETNHRVTDLISNIVEEK